MTSFTDDLTEIVEDHHCTMCAGHAFPQDFDYATLYLNDDQAITAIKQAIKARIDSRKTMVLGNLEGEIADKEPYWIEVRLPDALKQNLDLTDKEGE